MRTIFSSWIFSIWIVSGLIAQAAGAQTLASAQQSGAVSDAASDTAPALQPYEMNYRTPAAAHSAADLSFLLDAPAGRHGFIQSRHGHLFTSEGQRIRFWGVNITDWSPGSIMIPSKADAPLWAAALARFGVNCVRLQFLDLLSPRGLIAAGRSDTRAFDPAQLDREDYFLAELEKRGIYIDFNLLVGRPVKAGDGVVDAGKLGEGDKGVSLYDARLIELQKEYARQLLTHVNPYTRRAYSSDPAVAIVEINNENAIGVGFHPPSPWYARELETLYNRWLSAHTSPADLAALRQERHLASTDPLPLLASSEVAAAPHLRFDTESRFYLWLESGYFDSMRRYLERELGIRSLILATADHSHRNSGYPLLLATSSFPAFDGHDYWQHPWERKVKSPMVDDPLNSTPVELSRTAMLNQPYTVSEVNEPFPNPYGAEQIPILAAYGALQDWDAILWYTFEPKADPGWRPYIGDPFDISLDPVKMPELAAGALLFLRGDISAARQTVQRSYTRQQVFDSARLPEQDRPYFTPGFPLWIPLVHGSRIARLTAPGASSVAAQPAPDPIASDTAQLAWYKGTHGQVVVNTPRTQALIGFAAAERRHTANLSAAVANPFAVILLSALDAQPIARSSRLLLTTGARVVNTAMEWDSRRSDLKNWGGSPTLIEPVTGQIRLEHLTGATAVLVQPLDGSGLPLGPPLRAARSADSWIIAAGSPATTWYEVTVRR